MIRKFMHTVSKIFFALVILTFVTAHQVFAQSIDEIEVVVHDSRTDGQKAIVPERVAVLTWSLAEGLMALDVPVLAMADTELYNEWVVQPAIGENVEDIGSRSEPNLEKLSELKPDVILLADLQLNLIDKLEVIAPVIAFKAYDEKHDNYLASRQILLELGKIFDKQTLAQQKLSQLDETIDDYRQELAVAYPDASRPKVSTIRFNNESVIWIYGDNSMPQHVLQQLGFENALPQKNSQWGVVQKKINALSKVDNSAIIISYKPFTQADKLFNSPLWQSMPFVREGNFIHVDPVWSYGGVMSTAAIAQSVTEALMNIKKLKETTQDNNS